MVRLFVLVWTVFMFTMMLGVLPVFLLMFLGMLLDRFKVLPEASGAVLSYYVLKVALPMLLLKLISEADPGVLAQGGFWGAIFGGQVIAYALGTLGDKYIGGRRGGSPVLTGMACSCTNAAFMGLPLVASLFPGNAEAMLVAGMAAVAPAFMVVYVQPQMELLAARQASGSSALWPVFKRAILLNPIVFVLVVGSVLSSTGIGLWGPFARVADLVGSTCGTCALLALGFEIRRKLQIAQKAPGSLRSKIFRQAGISWVKLVIHPLATWALMVFFGVDGMWLVIGVLMSGVATAVGGYVLAESYGVIAEEFALVTVITNFLGLFTAPLIVYLLQNNG